MARITLRQLLDPRGRKHDYGVARRSTSTIWSRRWPSWTPLPALDAPVIIQAFGAAARSYANDIMLKHMMDAVHRNLSADFRSACHLDHGNGS